MPSSQAVAPQTLAAQTLAAQTPAPRDRLLLLQAGRGIAAICVALFHARLGVNAFNQAMPAWLEKILSYGYLGVDFFFILSGFIILHAHYDDRPGLSTLKMFVVKRLARVYIPYLPVCAVVIAAYLLLPSLSAAPRDWGWASSIFLVPSAAPPALVVAWSLIFEMLFYAIFTLFYAGRAVFLVAVLIWAAVILIGVPTDWKTPLVSTLTHPINLEFMFGMGLALAYRNIKPLQRIRCEVPNVLVKLGDASYAIYLIHNPLISLTARFAATTTVLDYWSTSLLFTLACIIAVGWAYHALFERKAMTLFRRLLTRRQQRVVAAT